MERILKSARFWSAAVVTVALMSLLLVVVGCGDTGTGTTTSAKTTAAVGVAKGKVYVAVTGSGELTAGSGNMGMAIVDLETKQVEMVNLPESKAPHGIIPTPDSKLAPDTAGRVTTEPPKGMLLGNAEDGAVLTVDLATNKVTKTAMPPAGAKLAICGMYQGPDGKIYLASMGDGNVYPYDPDTNMIGAAMPNQSGTTSICGITWSKDAKYAYLVNMFNPKNSAEAGYVAKIEWPSGKMVSKIDNVTQPSPTGAPLSHQSQVTPDYKWLYVTDGVDGSIIKINLDTETVDKRIPVGKEPHSILFSSDGKTGYIAVRHEPDENQSSVFVYDVEKDQVIDRIPGIKAPRICGLALEEVLQ